MNNIFLAEFRLFFKGRTNIWLLTAYFLLSIIALNIGIQNYENELQAYEKLELKYKHDLEKWMAKKNEASPGYIAYYLAQPAFFIPSSWSVLFPGERSEKLNLHRVRQLAIHGQIHGNPIRNLEHSVIGYLDFSIIWLYILPLLIGILSVTCIADEKRLGRWLLLSSVASYRKIILNKLAVKFIIISLTHLIFLSIAVFLLKIPIDLTLVKITTLLTSYTLFWFIISATIAFMHLNGRQSILTFTTIWMCFSWLFPSLHYASKMSSDTYNTGISLLLDQRQSMNDSWDRDKKADLDKFLKKYPEWQNTEPLGEKFDWKWYYAMQKLSDDGVSKQVQRYYEQKSSANSFWSYLSPNLITQNALEDQADTSSTDYVEYLEGMTDWHSRTQNFWFPYFFFKKEYEFKILQDLQPFIFQANNKLFLKFIIYWSITLLIVTFFLFITIIKPRKKFAFRELKSF